MKNTKLFTFISVYIIMIVTGVQAQGIVPNILVINLKEEIGTVFVQNQKGVVVIGVPSLDIIFSKYNVYKMEKEFPWERTPKPGSGLIDLTRYYVLHFSGAFNINEVISEFRNNSLIKYAGSVKNFRLYNTPDDTYFNQQWAITKIQANKAWDIASGDPSVPLAIIDTGVDWNHYDLDANIWLNPIEEIGDANGDDHPGVAFVDDDGDGLIDEDRNGTEQGQPGFDWNYVDDDDENGFIDDVRGWDFVGVPEDSVYEGEDPGPPDNDPMDFHGHGTHVAGIAAAETNNNLCIAGVAGGWYPSYFGAKIMAIRAGYKGANGKGYLPSIYAAQAISYATLMGAKVINCSFETEYREDLEDVVDNAIASDILVVVAAGNDNDQTQDYLNSRGDCLSIAATRDDDVRWGELLPYGSNYGTWIDVSAPGANIYSLMPNNNYYVVLMSGTSMAASHVTGLAGLILSVNPLLTRSSLSSILKNTSDDIYDVNPSYLQGKLGTGRINAYQALLLTLAYDNEAHRISPTIYNNQRIMARGKNDTDYLYLTYFSGPSGEYEVFFRRSTNDGSSWCEPDRVSLGDLGSAVPCIAVTDAGAVDHVHMVWWRKKSDGKFQVLYRKSTNSGNSWGNYADTDTLADNITCSSSQSVGPQPVITSISSTTSDTLIVVWTTSSGLRYIKYDSGWGDVGSIDDGSYNSYVRSPSIMGDDGWASLIYDTRYWGVYSRVFNGSSWTSRARVDESDTSYDRSPQIAITPDDSTLAVWYGYKSGKYRVKYRVGDSSNNWTDNYEEFAHENVNSLLPSVTYNPAQGTVGRAVVYYTDDKQVHLQKTTGSPTNWSHSEPGSNNRYVNISHVHSGTPCMIWTGDQNSSDPPYPVEWEQSGFSKTMRMNSTAYHRRAGIENNEDLTGLYIEIGEFEAVRKSGERLSLDFAPCHRNEKLDLKTNLMDNLSIKPTTLPSDVLNIEFYFEVYTNCQRDTSNNKVVTEFKNFDVNLHITDKSENQSYSTKKSFSNPDGAVSFNQTMAINVQHLAGKQVMLKPEIAGLEIDTEKYGFSLGHIHIEQDGKMEKPSASDAEQLTPNRFVLHQNIPNPFNPETNISYSIPVEGRVTLKIFDILGKEIIVLVDGLESAGQHRVIWDSRDSDGNRLPSGVYIYRLTSGSHVEQKKMILIK